MISNLIAGVSNVSVRTKFDTTQIALSDKSDIISNEIFQLDQI